MNRLRRNMTAGVLHGAFFQMATAFAAPFALLPVFFKEFTASNVLVGVAISLIQAGRVFPQLPIARLIRRRPGVSRPLMLAGIWTRFAVWGVIAALTLMTATPGAALAVSVVALLALYSMAGGVANLPLNRVIGETIPPDQRSSFFGLRLLCGGILAMLAGYVVKHVMGSTSLASSSAL